MLPQAAAMITPQKKVEVNGHTYYVDYEIEGCTTLIAIELDGFQFHGAHTAFTYDRMRQNDLASTGTL